MLYLTIEIEFLWGDTTMPIFEYHCTKCDKDFEILVFGDQSISCPICKGNNVKKLLSTFSHKSDGEFSSSMGSFFF